MRFNMFYIAFYALYSVQCTMYTIKCMIYKYTMYSVHCTLYIIQCTLYNSGLRREDVISGYKWFGVRCVRGVHQRENYVITIQGERVSKRESTREMVCKVVEGKSE